MILFLEDWAKYPEAIVWTDNPNRSFIDIANVYKQMGIKNYYFMLALHDRRLVNVDPFDPNITHEQITWIINELMVNPWYFFSNIVSSPGSTSRVPLTANRANIALIWSFFNHCQFMLLQPRQTGKTFSTNCLMTYLLSFTKFTKTLFYTKDNFLRVDNVKKVKSIFDLLPPYLNLINKRTDANNQETITVNANETRYNTLVPQAEITAAEKVGRGNTVEVRHCDEIAFCKNNFITIPTMGSAMNAAIKLAKVDNRPYGTIFTTTAGKKDTQEGKFAYEIMIESAEWDEDFLDCKNAEDFEKTVRERSNPQNELAKKSGLFAIQGTFSHRQLGYSDEWLLEQMTRNKVYGEEALRDYFNVWTSGTETSPFSVKQNEMISNSERDIVYRDIFDKGLTIKWYYNQEEIEYRMYNNPIIMGMDTSNNIGKDSSAITIIDATTLETIGAGNYNNISLTTYSKFISDLMIKYPRLFLVIENKLSGQAILDYLIDSFILNDIDPFKRMFNVVVNEKESNPRRFQVMDTSPSRKAIASQYRSYFGYTTTGTGRYSRDNLYGETLYRAIDIAADKIKDKRLIDELVSLVIKNDRIDHQDGKHDDQVISWLLACWFVFNGRNINYYDINRTRFLSNVTVAGEEVDYNRINENKIQNAIVNKIKQLYEELTNTDDYIDFNKIEKQIRLLESKVSYNKEILTLNEMIEELKEKRKSNMVKRNPDLLNDILDGLNDFRPNTNSRMFNFGNY